MAWSSAKEIFNDAAVELGLVTADVADPVASTDQALALLWRLLKKSGREIVREREWSHLTREHTLVTVALQKAYALPTDFRAMIPQTGWNRTGDERISGELSPQEWQHAKGTANTYAGRVLFRRAAGELWLLEDALPVGLTIAFEYRTNWWTSAAGGTAPTQEFPTASLDLVYLDAHLATRKLILDWRATKGFDTASAQVDYDDAYAKAAAADGSSRPLSLGGPVEGVRLVSDLNLPETVVYP